MSRLIKYALLALLIGIRSADGQSPGNLSDTISVVGFPNATLSTGIITGFIDSSAIEDFEKIERLPFNVTYRDLRRELAARPLHRNFWLKGTLVNRSEDTISSYFFCGLMNYVYLYFVSPHRPTQLISTGDLLNAQSKNRPFVQQVAQVLPLTLQPHQSGTVFIKIRQRTPNPHFEGLQVHSASSMYEAMANFYFLHRYEGLFALFFMGFVICQMLYVFFQWIVIKGSEYLYYTLYLLALILYFLNKDQIFIGTDILFLGHPILGVYFDKTLLLLPYFLYFRFIRAFLSIPSEYKALNKWIIILEYSILAFMTFDLIYVYTTFDIQGQLNISAVYISILFLVTLVIVYRLFLKRQRLIYYIFFGSLCVGLGNIMGVLSTYLQHDRRISIGAGANLFYAQIGIILEVICFTAGLSYKNRLNEKERIRNQQLLINQLKENERLQTRMQNIRGEISRDLHDDVGATLSTILLYSQASGQKQGSQSLNDALQAIHKIGETASRMIDNMGEMVWVVNPLNDKMEKIFNRMYLFAVPLFAAHEIALDWELQEDLKSETILMDQRKALYLIFKEAVNNAVKYARCSQMVISIRGERGILKMVLSDNGAGFDSKNPPTGNGMINMRQRATEINARLTIHSDPGQGTRITLQFPLSRPARPPGEEI